jgi:hypothetical protein
MNGSTPQEQGFALESLIHDALKQYHELECLREQDIRNKYRDQSMNGVDHWIICGNHSILIQDKWKETCSQSDVTQFLTCADRIKNRCPSMKFTFLWVSKKLPTSHALTTLLERDTLFVTCATSIEDLAHLVVKKVCEKFEINTSTASQPTTTHRIMAPQLSEDPVEEYSPTPSAPPPTRPVTRVSNCLNISHDSTIDGNDSIRNLKRIIHKIQIKYFRIIKESLHDTKIPILWQYVINELPESEADWVNGQFAEINYDSFLEQVERCCKPSHSYRCSENDYLFYIRVRRISTQLSPLAQEYNNVRESMLLANSAYAQRLPSLRCRAQPVIYEEYTSLLKYCYDYVKD